MTQPASSPGEGHSDQGGAPSDPGEAPPDRAVGDAIQTLMAARLGRAFIPLGGLFCLGVVGVLRGVPSAMSVALGAILTAAAILGYALRIVQKSLSRPTRVWMSVAMVGSIVPPAFALYAIGWLGLRRFTEIGSPTVVGVAIIHAALGVWVLRSWMRVVEIERLARVMMFNTDGEGGSA